MDVLLTEQPCDLVLALQQLCPRLALGLTGDRLLPHWAGQTDLAPLFMTMMTAPFSATRGVH